MEIEEFKTETVEWITESIKRMGKYISVSFVKILNVNEEEGLISGTVKINFKRGNCEHEHIVNVGLDNTVGLGYEDSDGWVFEINEKETLLLMYVDLALKDLDDKFLN